MLPKQGNYFNNYSHRNIIKLYNIGNYNSDSDNTSLNSNRIFWQLLTKEVQECKA